MTVLMRYPGLDMQIFESDTPVAWSSDEIEAAAKAESDSFVRRTALVDAGVTGTHLDDLPLSLILDRTEKAMTHLCEYIGRGTSIVEHEWGLYRGLPPSRVPKQYDSSNHPSIPKGFSLVAKENRVIGAAAISNKTAIGNAIVTRLQGYEAQLFLPPSVRKITFPNIVYLDIKPRQFVLNSRGKPVLVDIEPRVGDSDTIHEIFEHY